LPSKIVDSVYSYAKFWAEDLSAACDSVTWATWIYVSSVTTAYYVQSINRQSEIVQHIPALRETYRRASENNE
jgi:hypothetical protein